MQAKILNQLWRQSCRREAVAFEVATRNPRAAQSQTLSHICSVLGPSEWARQWNLSADTTIDKFQKRIPLSSPSDYVQAIHQISTTPTNPLSSERVAVLEQTSGTSSGEKLIPYTASLRREFQRAVAVWIYDLFTHRSHVMAGRAYWSVSPPLLRRRRTPSGIPIGFEDDTAYLSPWTRVLAKRLLAVPQSIAGLSNTDDWKFQTLRHLTHASNLSLISVWSPTFLSELVRCLTGPSRERLANESAANVSRILRSDISTSELTSRLWPSLSAISCWTDASARQYVDEIGEMFPSVEIVPKGLICTEGCVSIPLVDKPGAALALRSHFFEFLADDSEQPMLADELKTSCRYQVVMTTGGGLYRYRTGDYVEVVDKLNQCPLLRFVARAATSDLVGEKLSEVFVKSVLEQLWRLLATLDDRRNGFSMLVPDADLRCYRLFSQSEKLAEREDELDALLSENPYYQQARSLGQLSTVQICCDPTDRFSSWFQQIALESGIRPGNVKPVFLETNIAKAVAFNRRWRDLTPKPNTRPSQ